MCVCERERERERERECPEHLSKLLNVLVVVFSSGVHTGSASDDKQSLVVPSAPLGAV